MYIFGAKLTPAQKILSSMRRSIRKSLEQREASFLGVAVALCFSECELAGSTERPEFVASFKPMERAVTPHLQLSMNTVSFPRKPANDLTGSKKGTVSRSEMRARRADVSGYENPEVPQK